MKYGYREVKKIEASRIRGLCIKNNWFTQGTNRDYDRLLDYGFSGRDITTDELVEMAEMICDFSDYESIKEYEFTSIMYELNECCYTFFEEV